MDKPPTPLVIVHPEDVELAWVKARAAELGANATGSLLIPRGTAYIFRIPEMTTFDIDTFPRSNP